MRHNNAEFGIKKNRPSNTKATAFGVQASSPQTVDLRAENTADKTTPSSAEWKLLRAPKLSLLTPSPEDRTPAETYLVSAGLMIC